MISYDIFYMYQVFWVLHVDLLIFQLFIVKWKHTIIRLKCLIVAKYYYFAFCIAIVKSHPFFALIVFVDTLNTMFNISGDTGQPFFFLTSDIFIKMLGVEIRCVCVCMYICIFVLLQIFIRWGFLYFSLWGFGKFYIHFKKEIWMFSSFPML